MIIPSSSNQPFHGFHSTPAQTARSSSDTIADLDSLDHTPEPSSSQPSSSSSLARRSAAGSRIDDLLKSTLDVPDRRSRQPYKPPTDSSASMMDASFKASQYYDLRTRGDRSPGSLSRLMKFPNSPGAGTSSDPSDFLSDERSSRQLDLLEARRAKRSIRSRPSLGRTIDVDPDRGADFGRALRRLEILCAVNRVRADQNRQRFHERPGMKKKRLKSERWRRLFRESFRATVGRVKEMRRKGW